MGGLTVLRDVRALLPGEDLVYFGDQAHVPYGDRSVEELRHLLHENVGFLDAQGVDAIVVGCNTSSAVAARHGWPASRAAVLDLIEAAAGNVAALGVRRVGVVATAATARSGAYGAAIRRRVPDAEVCEIGAPELVPLVEAGTLRGAEPRAAVARACAQFEGELDALVLACTHFPFLSEHFAAELGPRVTLLDPARAQAERAAAFARERGPRLESGRTRYVTTGAREPFAAAIVAMLGPLGEGDSVETYAPQAALQ